MSDLYAVAHRLIGEHEIPGSANNGLIVWCLRLCGLDTTEETPWCSALLNGLCHLLGLERSKSAAARSWLGVGVPVDPSQWMRGDIAILSRGDNPAQGHVAIVHEIRGETITLLGGNQGDSVSLADFPITRLLGLRRLRQL